ncbi:MAG: hypothetical protein AB1Z65_10900 [Candidatus Sulfomarinibacteraceae bacterium]
MKKKSCVRPQTVYLVAVVVMVVASMPSPAAAGDGMSLQQVLENRIAAGDLEYRDARTGEVVVATQERIDAMRSDLERYFGQPPVYNEKVNASGAVVSVIGDAIKDVHLMRVNLDGTRTIACLRDLDAAIAFMVGLDTVENGTTGPRPMAVTR